MVARRPYPTGGDDEDVGTHPGHTMGEPWLSVWAWDDQAAGAERGESTSTSCRPTCIATAWHQLQNGYRSGVTASDSRDLHIDIEIERMVVDALDALPAPFRNQLGSVAIVIEDDATPAQLALVGAHGLYGLYQGVPRTQWSADGAPAPSKITIFRGPLVRANRTPEQLAAAVADTVYHEIAHHFGISDERLHELKRGQR